MGQRCEICDKVPVRGKSLSQRGKAKYLGGNGRKTTGITLRSFRPNLQQVRCQEGTTVVKRRVCVKCIRAGRVTKAVVRKPFTLPTS